MSVLVEAVAVLVDKVDAMHDPVSEVGVVADSRVDDGDPDAATGRSANPGYAFP